MDSNYRNQELLGQLSPILGISKASLQLSPIMRLDSLKLLDKESNYDLENFRLCELEELCELEKIVEFPVIQQLRNEPNEEKLKIDQQLSQRSSSMRGQAMGETILEYKQISAITCIIKLLVQNSTSSERDLLRQVESLASGSQQLMEVYWILLRKFKKLKKTKEQMNKYCIRKAFKVISDKTKLAISSNGNLSSPSKSSKSTQLQCSTYKKFATQKTINCSFLKKIFNEEGFLEDYQYFLSNFKEAMEEDNERKIQYLTSMIQGLLRTNSIKKIQGIKRLPWTTQILLKTYEIAHQLPRYAHQQASLAFRKANKQ